MYRECRALAILNFRILRFWVAGLQYFQTQICTRLYTHG
jgi:hypothetical protein